MPVARPATALLAFVAALAVAPAQAAFGPVGALDQLPGADGCVDDAAASGCRDTRATSGIGRLGVAPDGSAIVAPAAGTDSVAVLRRDPGSGVVGQSGTVAGCVAPPGNTISCRAAPNLEAAADAAFSPDGRHVYVAGSNGIAAFEYVADAAIGGLVPLSGVHACWSNTGTAHPGGASGTCQNGRALSGLTAIAVSPDGGVVYATVDAADDSHDGVVILRRDAATGRLSQDDAPSGCVTKARTADGDGDVSPLQGCGGELRAIDDPSGIAVAPDGATVYVASRQGVAMLRRADGTLMQTTGSAGCVVSAPQPGCTDARALEAPYSLAVSGDGADLYVSNAGLAEVAHFDVAADGTLSQAGDASGCVSSPPTPGDGALPCASGRALGGSLPGAAVSPDGATVAIGGSTADEIALFDRDGYGGLSQPADRRGCVNTNGSGSCLAAAGTAGTDFAWSTGAHHFYAAGGQSMAFLRREVAPACDEPAVATDSLTPVTVRFACSDLNGDAVRIEVAAQPAGGSLGASGEHAVLYTPRPEWSGLDTFAITPRDHSGNPGRMAAASVDVTWRPAQTAPPTAAAKAPLPRLLTRTMRPDRRGRLRLRLACPGGAAVACRGKLRLVTAKVRLGKEEPARRIRVLEGRYDVRPGTQKRLRFKPNRRTRRLLLLRRRTRVVATLSAPATAGLAAARSRAVLALARRSGWPPTG